MKLKIRSLHMENFKWIKSLDVNFSNKTSIKGQNASGKTTIFDAFTWLLFNKNSAGEEKFNVRPLDKDGKRIDNVEIKVSAVFDKDGEKVEISKVQKQNWVKKRGTNTVALQGNTNSFEIDGYPKSETDYKAFIAGLINEDLFRMLTNPQYFSSLKWKDQRDILMKLVAEVSDVELAQTDAKYTPLIDELEKAPSTDDIRAKFSKALSEWKKKQSEIPVRIDEAEKSKVDVDVAEQELAKADLERKISECYQKISGADKSIDRLQSEELQLQFDLSGIMQTMNRELSDKSREYDDMKYEASIEFQNIHNQIADNQSRISGNEESIRKAEVERKKLGEQYNMEKAKTFDETPYLFDESKWVFDENSTVCSLCGQKLPEDKIEQLKTDFEMKKAKAKAELETKHMLALNEFKSSNAAKLQEIVNSGYEKKNLIEKLTSENESLKKEMDELKQKENSALAKKNEAEKRLSEIPAEADYSQNEEYAKLKARHNEVLAEIEKLESDGADQIVNDLKAEKSDLQSQLDEVNKIIAKASMNVEIDERIAQLQAEQKEIGQKVADQEQMIYLLEDFIRFKLNKVSESINSHFKTVNFKLFEMQLNGGMKDCCECTVNGIPYSALNSGHRIIAELDIISSLSELYGLSVPIFVDNAESLNEFNVPDMDAQLILLSVSEDKQLKVEGV